MKIYTAEQLYEADKATVEKQEINSLELMERAANKIFQWLDARLKGSQVPIHIFCGIGNNGGDGMALGRLLLEKGYAVKCYVVNYSDKRSKCFLINYDRFKQLSKDWPLLMKSEADFPAISKDEVIIDAIFGIGLNRPLKGWLKKLVIHLNKSNAFVLSIDIPSGLFVDEATPDKEAVIEASYTLTFQAPKLVFFLPETGVFTQNFDVLDIGLDREYLEKTSTSAKLILRQDVLSMYIPREKFSHKGTYGHSVIIGGSYGKIGAIVLAASSCLRTGTGKVTVLAPKCGYGILQTALPEAMVITGKEEEELTEFSFDVEVATVGVGPGIGTSEKTTKGFLVFLKNQKQPMVIDADGLNILSENKKSLKDIPKKSVLTPHPGELQRLIGEWKDDFDKLEKLKKFSKKHDLVMVVKGAHTLTVYNETMYVNSTGNPGMATAGTGDVLTGMITAMISQGYDTLVAAIFAVYLHGRAGDLALEETGYQSLIAGDIIRYIGPAFLDLFRQEPSEKV